MTLKKLAEESSNGDNNNKLFQDMERKDVITFLDRYRSQKMLTPCISGLAAAIRDSFGLVAFSSGSTILTYHPTDDQSLQLCKT